MTELRIERAALKMDDGKIISLPRPARHHDLIRHACAIGDYFYVRNDQQGFLTNDERWVNRYEAMEIALAANQLTERGKRRVESGMSADMLFSEDVWEGRYDG